MTANHPIQTLNSWPLGRVAVASSTGNIFKGELFCNETRSSRYPHWPRRNFAKGPWHLGRISNRRTRQTIRSRLVGNTFCLRCELRFDGVSLSIFTCTLVTSSFNTTRLQNSRAQQLVQPVAASLSLIRLLFSFAHDLRPPNYGAE